MRSENLLVLVLTRRCDRRCGFCPQAFDDADMSEATLDAALGGLLPLLARPARVKLFGGEPLLRPDLASRAVEAVARLRPGTRVELVTHAGGLDAVESLLRLHPEVELYASRPDPRAARVPGAVHNLLIAPGEEPASVARRLGQARLRGFARFNFLPAYFVCWTPEQRRGLDAGFAAARAVLGRLAAAGRPAEVVNLSRRGTTPLYNDGLVVDADGEVYASNLVLAAPARAHRERLRLGSVAAPDRLAPRPPEEPEAVLARAFAPEILESTRAADAALTRFCRSLEAEPLSPGPRGRGARSDGGPSVG